MLLVVCGPLPQDFLLSALLAAEKTLGYRVVNLIEGSDRMTGESTPNPEWLLDPWAPEKGAWIPGNVGENPSMFQKVHPKTSSSTKNHWWFGT